MDQLTTLLKVTRSERGLYSKDIAQYVFERLPKIQEYSTIRTIVSQIERTGLTFIKKLNFDISTQQRKFEIFKLYIKALELSGEKMGELVGMLDGVNPQVTQKLADIKSQAGEYNLNTTSGSLSTEQKLESLPTDVQNDLRTLINTLYKRYRL